MSDESLLQEACDVCGRQAVIVLSDSQHREPLVANGKLWARYTRHGGARAFCAKHARPPRVFGPNGKLVQEVPINV